MQRDYLPCFTVYVYGLLSKTLVVYGYILVQ